MNIEQMNIWNQCLDFLQEAVPSSLFSMWICPLQVQQLGDVLTLGAPNRIVFDEVQRVYLPLIKGFFEDILPGKIKTFKVYVVGEVPVAVASPLLPSPSSHNAVCPVSGPLGDNSLAQKSKDSQHESDLKPDFTFRNFIIGKSNQLAEAAAEQVAISPGTAYNPLFLYGGVGLGKTHLIHSIGNRIRETKPHLKVRYLHSERFVSDMVKAIQSNSLDEFKSFYRTIDILMIDDIQFFAGKERSQEEFFYTFNTLLDSNQQIILTSDRFPKDLGGIADRLKSRFGSGLTVAVDPPDLETRVAILMKKSEAMNIAMTPEIAFYIAQHVRTNIRELEGALKRVIAHTRFMSRPLTIDLAQRALKDVVAAHERLTSVSNIIQIVSEHFCINPDDMLSSSRLKKYAGPRQIGMALCKELTSLSFPEIGKSFGGRDHTTIMHACRKIDALRQTDASVAKEYYDLVRQLSH